MPSAKEVIETAEINKSTFYYHYESVRDLLDQIEQELFDEVMAKALEDIEGLSADPAGFLERFGSFFYEEASSVLVRTARFRTTVFDAVIESLDDTGTPSIDRGVIEVVLLGLWGFACRVSRDEYERSIPAIASMLAGGVND